MAIAETTERKVLAGERLSREEGVALLARRRPARAGHAGRRGAPAPAPRGPRHLHHRPQHQLHERVRGPVRVLRLLPRPAFEGGLPPLARSSSPRRSRRRSRWAATRSCSRAACTPTSASSSTRSCSGGSRGPTRSGSTASRRPRSSTSTRCRRSTTEQTLRRLIAAGPRLDPGRGSRGAVRPRARTSSASPRARPRTGSRSWRWRTASA